MASLFTNSQASIPIAPAALINQNALGIMIEDCTQFSRIFHSL